MRALPYTRHRRLADLRAAVERLPRAARVAMLEGIARERVIAGGYTDSRGGVCPMLAAHRCGQRTSGSDFARVWDLFADAARPTPARRGDVEALRTLLEASLEESSPAPAWLRPVRRYDDLCALLEDAGVDADVTLDVLGGRRSGSAVMSGGGMR